MFRHPVYPKVLFMVRSFHIHLISPLVGHQLKYTLNYFFRQSCRYSCFTVVADLQHGIGRRCDVFGVAGLDQKTVIIFREEYAQVSADLVHNWTVWRQMAPSCLVYLVSCLSRVIYDFIKTFEGSTKDDDNVKIESFGINT